MTKKGFKVTNLSREKKIGVAADSLNELLKKSCEKFMVKDMWQKCKCYVADDGTLVDDDEYFNTLEPQTLLVVVQPDETMKTEFEHLYEMIRSTKTEYLKAGGSAQDFLSKNLEGKIKRLNDQIHRAESNKVYLTNSKDDLEWFEGTDTNDTTKEAFMRRKAKDRIKGYFYKTKQLLTGSELYINSRKGQAKIEIDLLINNLRSLLEANKYHCFYFDRSNDCMRLCNDEGEFKCGGLWNEESCKYGGSHSINPYRSREERILFQTWNLDHRIELSRSTIPNILQAVQILSSNFNKCQSCRGKIATGHLSAHWYHKEIFTVDNLKLVHIVCHDKAKHNLFSDEYIVCERCYKNEIFK